jgi:fructose-bisphosphate aldolase/6-deoxy-5-ketofructose 1-phosphate synthase
MNKIQIPLSVPNNKHKDFIKNYELATLKSGNLFLFAGDQKVEHLNQDFSGAGIDKADKSPEHLFQIAASSKIGVFAAQFGLIDRYGANYKKISYLVKLNSKTNLAPDEDGADSRNLVTVADVVDFKKQSKLNIVGIGYTVYIGGKTEARNLQAASQAILNAHKNGLIAIIWMYPRGPKIKNEEDINLIAGGAGVAACLGADFVKLKYPYTGLEKTAQDFKEVTAAAGHTKVICAGGSRISSQDLLKNIYQQINISKTNGIAIGRNLHQLSLAQAVKLANAIHNLVINKSSLEKALKILK